MELSRVDKKTGPPLKQLVYNHVAEAITSFQLAPGAPLVEQDIAAQLGMSRTPVREALKELEKDGLVLHLPGRGTFVRTLTVADVEEMFFLREALEVAALRKAIMAITDQEIAAIREAVCRLGADSPPEQFFNTDNMLHGLLIRKANNKRLHNFYALLNYQVESIRRIANTKFRRMDGSSREHLEILDSLLTRDLVICEVALRRHLNNAKNSILEVCRTEDFVSLAEKPLYL